MAPPKSSQGGSGGADNEGSSASSTAGPGSSAAHKSSLASKSSSPFSLSSHKQPASSSSSSFVLPRMSDPAPPPSTNGAKRSLSPTVAPTSSSAKRPSRDSTGNADAKHGTVADSASSAGNATHYGTRSRNRTGGARPNYAEDRDIDVDMLADSTPSARREDEPKKSSSRSAATTSSASVSGSTNSNAWTIASLLDREPLRPTNNSANSTSERERSRKPLPGTSANGSDSAANTSSSTSSSHSSSASNTKSSSHLPQKDNDKDTAKSSATSTEHGTSQSQSSSSQSRKRKAASSSVDKAATNGNGASHGSSTSLLNISLKKNGAAAAAAAAAAASSSSTATKKGVKRGYNDTNLMTFEKHGSKPNKDGKLVADDGSLLSVNDHVYLVCEPPGEPYYLARVMEFMYPKNNTSLPVDALRVNWYYRPRDIGRKTQDTRCVFATMHSDITPLTALRGKCTIKHKAEIDGLDEFRRAKDSFWFEKLYDRYIQKNYEVIPTTQIVNVPERVKRVLHERWRFVLVEQGRGKDLTAAAKQCKRCSGFCASNNSVDCAVCSKTYHMSCVRPPLLKKPSRGFAWSCAACSRAQERLLEARHTPNVVDGRTPDVAASATAALADEDEFMDEDDDECPGANPDQFEDPHPEATAEQQYQASLWPYRYLGIHAKVEDALDYDDRIYPRAATRVGPRHQAVVLPWAGRPVAYVNPPDIKKATRREARQNKEAIAAYEKEREARPKWVQDTPAGYVHRGEDYNESDERCTAFALYKSPTAPPREAPMHEPTESAFAVAAASAKKKKTAAAAASADAGSKMDLDPPKPEKKKAEVKQEPKEVKIPNITDAEIDQYMAKAVSRATKLGVPKNSTNLYDVAAELLFRNDFNTAKALKQLDQKKATEFKEPMLTALEQKKFEEAVTKFGSELNLVTRHVKSVHYGDIVRWYYAWKKSERGKIVWGNNASRKGKKEAKEAKKAEAAAANKIQDDVADDVDDSAFDADKATAHKRQFLCKFCNTKSSRQWRRAPAAVQMGVLAESLGGGNNRGSHRDRNQNQTNQQFVAALCRRCAELWRRYAVQWEDVEALTAKVASAGGRLVKRKLDEELMKEIAAADDLIRMTEDDFEAHHTSSSEPPRKKLKGQNGTAASAEKDRDLDHNASDSASSTPAPTTSSSRRRDRSDKNHADKSDKATAEKEKAAAAAAASHEKASASSAGKSGAASGAGTASSAASTPAASAPPAPEIPQLRKLPCAVCYQMDLPTGDQRVTCRDCRLTVHRTCYGVLDNRSPVKWLCDMCSNDRNPHKSIDYRCVLCPVDFTSHELAPEPARSTHKKKSDKDRERERAEREQAQKAIEHYRQRQEDLNKPLDPREALKRTADNNWVHVTCAVWTPEVKFGKAKALEPSEGIPSVPRLRYDEMCKVCKGTDGACVSCHQCRGLYHVECAHQAGHIFGFDLVPIKGSRRDQANMVTINGVSGQLSAAIWCQEHVPLKGSVHSMHEVVDDTGMTVFQLYVNNYKQADLTLTGCARKANLLTAASKSSAPGSNSNGSNGSNGNNGSAEHASQQALPQPPAVSSTTRRSSLFLDGDFANQRQSTPPEPSEHLEGNRVCFTCGGDVSPKWHPIGEDQQRELANGHHGRLGTEAQKFVDQRHFQCHQCKKLGRQPSPHIPSASHLHALEPSPEQHQYQQQSRHQPPMHNGHQQLHQQRHQHQYPYGSSVVKTEEDIYASALQRVAPHYAQDRGPSLPPPQARTPGQPPLPSLAQPVSQSPLAPPPMSRQVSQPMLSQPPLHHQQSPHGPSPVQHQHNAQHQQHQQLAQHAQPSRSQPSHHHIMHPADPPRAEPLRRPSFSHAQQPPPQHPHQHTPVQTHAQTGGPPMMGGSSRSPPEMSSRYWSSGHPPPPPPLPHQAPPPLSMRPSSRGSPSGGPPLSVHSSHGMPPHHSPHSIPAMSSRSSVGAPPPQPVHSYHNGASSSSSSGYSSWPRSSGGPPPPPPRREPLHHSGSSSSMASPITHNHLRPPPPSTVQHSSTSNGMQNGSGSGYMGQGMMNGRLPSPPRRSMGGPPMPHERGGGSSYGGGHSSYGSSMSPHVQHSSPSHHFSQILHPQRSSASSSYNSVTREDFTLRGPSTAPAPRPSDGRNDSRDSRNASSASSNPSLRNLLS